MVGLPARADGGEHPVGKLARRFAQRLQGRFGVRAELVDEHLTSHDAEHSLRSAGARGARLKAGLDAVAAQRILETFFEIDDRQQEPERREAIDERRGSASHLSPGVSPSQFQAELW